MASRTHWKGEIFRRSALWSLAFLDLPSELAEVYPSDQTALTIYLWRLCLCRRSSNWGMSLEVTAQSRSSAPSITGMITMDMSENVEIWSLLR